MFDRLHLAWHFLRTRYLLNFKSNTRLLVWQQRQLSLFLRNQLHLAPYYQPWLEKPLDALPIVDKAEVMSNFSAMNTANIQLEDAMALAVAAETSRNFAPELSGVSIGLSSGTSGNRGLFLANTRERNQWAGILLARLLPTELLKQILQPWRVPLRIAFFLRANSNVYTTLASRRIDFVFYDLFEELSAARAALQQQQPDVLVAPANVLKILAQWAQEGLLNISPRRVVSVAEVLEADEAKLIQQVFSTYPLQIYQATEGFLGYTCEQGQLHLNETFLHIEKEWLDAAHTRFQPIITDFTRQTQLMVRYRLNDVLRVASKPCSCGRAEMAIEAIEGRADDVLWLPDIHDSTLKALFPDFVRRAMLLVGECVQDYRVIQENTSLIIEVKTDDKKTAQQQVKAELEKLWSQQSLIAPQLLFTEWELRPSYNKRRRVYCKQRPLETVSVMS